MINIPKFLHIADLHLASPLGGLPQTVARTLRDEGFALLERACRMAGDTDALLISGDLFNTPTVSKRTAERVATLLEAAQIPVFIAPGNHDFYHDNSPYALTRFSDNVHIFKSGVVQRVQLDGLDVYGAGFISDSCGPSLGGFRADANHPSAMVLHGELSPSTPKYNPVTPAEIEATGLNYLALGHVHLRSKPETAGRTLYAFSGCPMGRGFDETGERGGYLVTIDDTTTAEFVSFGARRFLDIEVRADAGDLTRQIFNALPSGSERDIARVAVVGEAAPESFDCGELERQLAERCFYIKVSDKTILPRRVWERTDEDTLAGHALRILQNDGDADVDLAARYVLAALDGGEQPR